MPKWKADAKEFSVSILHDRVRGYSCTVPMPIMEKLGVPEKLRFVIKGSKVEVEGSSA